MEQQEQIDAVQRMQEFMQAHINEPVTLLDLSRQAGYSPFHSARIFKEHTGKGPFEYLRALRLSSAALRLRDEKVKVLDVALDFVFDSQEGFTRAFSKAFGLTPARYQKSPPPICLFMPTFVRARYAFYHQGERIMEKKEKPVAIFVQVIDRPARKVLLKRGKKAEDYFEYCEEVGCDIWGMLCSVKEALYEPIGMWLPNKYRPSGTSYYAQGVEVPADYRGEVPEGLELMDLPPCQMMVFQGPAFEDERFEEAIVDVWELMKTYQPELYGFAWADEDGPRFQMEPQGYRGYIEGRPVRRVNKG